MDQKFSAIYNYTKKVNGIKLPITKMLGLYESESDARDACIKYYKDNIKTNIEQFSISTWVCDAWQDQRRSIPIKTNEQKISLI